MMYDPEALNNRPQIDLYVDEDGMVASMAEEVREGLMSSPKHLPPKYFYDEEGSKLFEAITELPEYYPSRAERELLAISAVEIMEIARPTQLVELGSGSSSKTRILLKTPVADQILLEYIPFDVSSAAITESTTALAFEYPSIRFHGVVGDFLRHLDQIPEAQGTRLVLFLGGTIGNLYPLERLVFLKHVKSQLGPNGKFLIGVDLVKDIEILEAAYNDSSGITATFNKNMLKVLNRGLGGNFDISAFNHWAFYNAVESRIEMHLVPNTRQDISLSKIDLRISVSPLETIWTESSHKFTETTLNDMLAQAGLQIDRFFTNDRLEESFGLVLASAFE